MEADPAEADTESAGETPDLLDDVDGLGELAEKLKPQALAPISAAGIAEAIDELAGGQVAVYVNTDGEGINRLGVVTDDFTVRVLMLTTRWKWRGPYTPDDPEGYLTDRGYVPAPEVSEDG